MLVATLVTPVFLYQSVNAAQAVAIWMHFYHCVGFMVAAWNYGCMWFAGDCSCLSADVTNSCGKIQSERSG